MFNTIRRLHARGAASRGLAIDADGAVLGPGCVLVRRSGNRYLTASRAEAAAVQRVAFGADRGPDWLFDQCGRVAKALNDNQLALAQIYGVRAAPGDLDDRQLAMLGEAARMIKANFDPDEGRVPAGNPDGGQWTTGDGFGGSDRQETETDGIWSDYVDVAWNGDYHQYLVQHFADLARANGGAAVTEVPLAAIDGTSARTDLIVRPAGSSEPYAIEIKTGTDWRLTPNQQRVYNMLPIGGHVTANKAGLEQLGLVSGQPLPAMRILFVVTVGPDREMRYGWWPPE